MRCAIYARYSSDLQRESSIEDQVRKCRTYAVQRGWTILEDYVRADQAISGASTLGRDALQSLVSAAKQKKRPFDRILVDDTSRLARNVADSLKLIEILRFHGVPVTAVSQNIDSGDKSARPLLTLHGMMDEQFLVGLADKVRRGQEGRVLNGFHAGGRCYGYRSVPIEDPSRPGKYGRPAVVGVELAVVPEEAEVVRRIFQLYADGLGLAGIAKKLNAEGVPSPRPRRGRDGRAWCPTCIREMLRNERYRGVQVWNKHERVQNPETGRKTMRSREKSAWVHVDTPEWRIVPEALWNSAHARIRLVNERLGSPRVAAMHRTARSRKYLFSGLLICGACGSRMVIVGGGGDGAMKYGCPSHRYRGICDNRLVIRQDRLEEQLLAALEHKILSPNNVDRAVRLFEAAVHAKVEENSRDGKVEALRQEREDLVFKAKRLGDAIAESGHSPTLLAMLSEVEGAIGRVDARMAEAKVRGVASGENLREFARRNIRDLRSLLREDVENARAALQKHVPRISLNPAMHEGRPVFEVSGQVDLSGGAPDVMRVVAGVGFEPTTFGL